MFGLISIWILDNSTVIAHAGDGNFHTVVLFDPNQEDQRKEAERLNNFMVHTALEMEGLLLFNAVLFHEMQQINFVVSRCLILV